MSFNSVTYLVFMAVLAPLVALGPAWLRRFVLLFGSLVFYAFWRIDFTALVILTAFIDYVAGMRMGALAEKRDRKYWLVLSLTMNLMVLAFFKYAYFVLDAVHDVAGWFGGSVGFQFPFSIILPLGISFYTFHSMSYTIDVYRGVQKPVRRFDTFLTYVMLWPQLIAGPILRAGEVVPQIDLPERPRMGEVIYGLEEILQGLFKKVVLADGMARVVDPGFELSPSELGPLDVWVLAFAFGLQIYFDFSGYSQVALGSARVMGFHFPRNFDWPYLARSPQEFWKRWHISLSSWIRDYLYLPLLGVSSRGAATGGLDPTVPSAASAVRRIIALFLTWFIMGLWHGANWTFALWGLWHATLILLHRAVGKLRERIPMQIRHGGGFAFTLVGVMLGWLFFRARTAGDALALLTTAFDLSRLELRALRENDYLVTFLCFAAMLLTAGAIRASRAQLSATALRTTALACINAVLFFFTILTLRNAKQFVYFQF